MTVPFVHFVLWHWTNCLWSYNFCKRIH